MARPTLFSSRKLLKLAQRLQSKALAVGTLELIWHSANETGNPVLGDADDIEALSDWRGQRGELVAALMEAGSNGGAGFIVLGDDGRYEIHDYWHHAPDYVRKRAVREQQRREKGDELSRTDRSDNGSKPASDQSVTSQRPVSDRSVTGQNGGGSPKNGDFFRTPAPAPAPAPLEIHTSATPPPKPRSRSASVCIPPFHQEVIDAYHRVLPDMPPVKAWTRKRCDLLNARIAERVKDGKPADGIAYWVKFFESVSASDFLCGRSSDFRCSLEWLLLPMNFLKVIEGTYTNRVNGSNGGRPHAG